MNEKGHIIYSRRPAEFAKMYEERKLWGGHVIKLGPGNDDAAKEALAAWPGNIYCDHSFTVVVNRGLIDRWAANWWWNN